MNILFLFLHPQPDVTAQPNRMRRRRETFVLTAMLKVTKHTSLCSTFDLPSVLQDNKQNDYICRFICIDVSVLCPRCLVSTCPLPLPICPSAGRSPHVSPVLLRVCLCTRKQTETLLHPQITLFFKGLGAFSLTQTHPSFLSLHLTNYHFNFHFFLPSGHSSMPSFFSSIPSLCPPHIPPPSSVSPLIASSSKWDAEARNLM